MNAILTLINLAGFIALLLWGVHMVESGLQKTFGARLKSVLGSALRNRPQSFITGVAVTTILQSSTAVGLMASSFVAHGIITLSAALALMLGANVGTTLIVQVLSFDITAVAPLLVLLGVVMFRSFPKTRAHDLGRVAIGLGLMLFALEGLMVALKAVDGSDSFRTIIGLVANQPIIGLLLAAFLAWMAHSSVAIMLLTISLASHGTLPLETALAFVLGANLGTAVNPWLESRHGDNPASRRLPVGNLINRLVAVAVAFPFLSWLAPLILSVESDHGRAIADFHTVFNLVSALITWPLLTPFEKLLRRMMPDLPGKADIGAPLYLDKTAHAMPVMALANAAREALRMVDVLREMMTRAKTALADVSKARQNIAEAKALDDALDKLNAAIKHYLAEMDPDKLTEADRKRLNEVLAFITNIEHAGDVLDRSVLHQAAKRMKRGVTFSSEGFQEIESMIDRLFWNLQAASVVFMTEDTTTALQLADEKAKFRDLESSATEAHFARLREGRSETKATTSMHLDLVRDLKLINAHLVSAAAYPVLEEKGQLLESRITAK